MAKIRLDKYLADMQIGTRSAVKEYIRKGRVRVNEAVVKSPEQKIDTETDTVLYDDKPVGYHTYEYFMLNKPQGVVSATQDTKEKTVTELITEKNRKNRRKINAMKATGIVRRIDDLGRVVVPKEIRRTLRIREGDPLEIFTDKEGEIILKKYSPIGELSAFAKQYAESLSQMLGCLAGICDMDQVVAAAGNGKKELQDEDITRELGEFLKERKTQNAKAGEKRYVPVVSKTEPYSQEVISPILCAGDVIGAVLLLNMDQKDLFEEREICLAEYTAKVLGKQMEQ